MRTVESGTENHDTNKCSTSIKMRGRGRKKNDFFIHKNQIPEVNFEASFCYYFSDNTTSTQAEELALVMCLKSTQNL